MSIMNFTNNIDENIISDSFDHFADKGSVILDSENNVISYTESFLDIFDLSKKICSKKLPSTILNAHDTKQNIVEFIKKNSEIVRLSFHISVLQNNENCDYRLITYKDLSDFKLREQFKRAILNIAQLVNSSDNIKEMCDSILVEICNITKFPSSFICLYDNTNKNFFIDTQIGLNELYKCHSCNYLFNENAVPDNKKSCFKCYSRYSIEYENLLNHSISKYITLEKEVISKFSIIHVPLISDSFLIGLLHISAPKNMADKLFNNKDLLTLIANEITVGIKRIRLVHEIKQYAENLEKVIKLRTDQLREKDAQLIQSGKLATLGELATGIAHEINQPLGGISLITQGLIMAKARGKLLDTLLIEKLNQIIDQIDRINNIITHLRTFARQTDNIKVEVDIRKPLLDVFKLIGQQLVNKEIEVILDIDEEIPIILAEHNRLEQVFLNIISNARDSLEDMEKNVSNLNSENNLPKHLINWRKRVVIKAYRDTEKLVLEFLDNGTGIPHSIINKIFDPFFTTKEVGKGTGLGLSITYGIVRDFSGIIEIESEEMKGSKFIIKFPIHKSAINI